MAAGTRPRTTGILGGPRTTVALVVALLLLVGVGAAEILYLTGDDEASPSTERPVVTGALTHRSAVESAARSAEEILSTSYDSYAEDVDRAAAVMTETFAEEYRRTAAGLEDRFVAGETQLQVEAVAQGVVRASAEEVQALLFLDQYVQERDEDGKPRTHYAQYRALVTVVDTDQGWKVSSIETE
jgi:Mce-associated membrane protein